MQKGFTIPLRLRGPHPGFSDACRASMGGKMPENHHALDTAGGAAVTVNAKLCRERFPADPSGECRLKNSVSEENLRANDPLDAGTPAERTTSEANSRAALTKCRGNRRKLDSATA